MTMIEQAAISELVNVLKHKSIFWSPDEDTCKKVLSISKRFDEPSLCANFEGGEYVALCGCELSSFIVGERLNDIWKHNY